MYHYFSGTLDEVGLDYAVIDCTGIGYRLTVSANTTAALSGKRGEYVKLYAYLSIREDAHELFGFFTEEEKTAFCLLITVSGIGPKAAMAILSVLTPEKLGMAISGGDVKAITSANGVGKKGAERVILELKDKYKKNIAYEEVGITSDGGEVITTDGSARADATAVLMSLGYTRQEISYALKGMAADLDCDGLVRGALAKLMK